jgi:hypothetical protein
VTDLREDMAKAVEAQIVQLAHIRDCRRVDAAIAVAQSYADNLRDSRETSMESYWEAMAAIADGIVATETGGWTR